MSVGEPDPIAERNRFGCFDSQGISWFNIFIPIEGKSVGVGTISER